MSTCIRVTSIQHLPNSKAVKMASVPKQLRPTSRFITGHNSEGKSVFETSMSPEAPVRKAPDGMEIFFNYGTQGFPVQLSDNQDLQTYQHLIEDWPGIVVPNGTAARIVDFPPGCVTPMHRSLSLNYNFVIEGEVEVILDSGEVRRLGPGDMLVQRAIMHAWRNVSKTEWARISAIPMPVEPFKVCGKVVEAAHGPSPASES